MTRLMTGLVVCWAMVAAPFGQAQEKYTIKIKEAGKGDTYKSTTTETTKSTVNVVDNKDKSFTETSDTGNKSFAFVVSILEKATGAEKPTSSTKTYEKAAITRNGETRVSSLEGKKLLIEKKGDKFEYRQADGKELSADELGDLDSDLNKGSITSFEKSISPKKPVQLNESWVIESADFAKGLDEAAELFDLTKIKLQAKLVRVYQKDGRQFGIIEFDYDLPFKQPRVGKMALKGSFDGCIDGSLNSRVMKLTMTGEMRIPQDVITTQVTLNGEISRTTEEIRQKGKKE
jgi:hypothetical protein